MSEDFAVGAVGFSTVDFDTEKGKKATKTDNPNKTQAHSGASSENELVELQDFEDDIVYTKSSKTSKKKS